MTDDHDRLDERDEGDGAPRFACDGCDAIAEDGKTTYIRAHDGKLFPLWLCPACERDVEK